MPRTLSHVCAAFVRPCLGTGGVAWRRYGSALAAIALGAAACARHDGPPTGPGHAAKTIQPRAVAAVAQVRPAPGFPVTDRDCPRCYLHRRDLASADLSQASLAGADLGGADLRQADLRAADLADADLSWADLRGADLTGARLVDARLDSARLDGADLGRALWLDGMTCAEGSVGGCVTVLPDEPGFRLAAASGVLVHGGVAKWSGGHRAAVSITYDSAYGTWIVQPTTAQMVVQRGLRMDHEIVTAFYRQPRFQHLVPRLHTDLVDRGLGLYGHGHEHVDHDALSYEKALASMLRCFAEMQAMGLRPRAYAYPYSAGHEAETQRACRNAGFICARGSTLDLEQVYICPGDTREPHNWYYLPAVSMARDFPGYVNDDTELAPVLARTEELGAWVILMYHAIGKPRGWGYYPTAEFEKDLDRIAAGDFWSGNLDAVAAYVQERNAARVHLLSASPTALVIALEDGLDDALFDEPLTLELELGSAVDAVTVETGAGRLSPRAAAPDHLLFDVLPDGRPITLHLAPAP